MSEKEKSGGGAESSLVLVEKSTVSRHKQPFRPIDMQEDTTSELHKRSKAPAVPSVADDLKQSVHTDIKEKKESKSSETHLHSASKKMSSTKKRSSSPEPIALTPMPTEAKRSIIAPSQPIPAQVSSASSVTPDQTANKNDEDSREEEDGLTGEITELRTPEVTQKSAEWSDDEEAGGLPRSESRGSRVSRAMRQLFCCGIQLETPSEHRISPRSNAI